MYGWSGLHVWCEDLGVSTQINEKCITGPVTLDFDDIEGNVAE